jgi:hypothetical protein
MGLGIDKPNQRVSPLPAMRTPVEEVVSLMNWVFYAICSVGFPLELSV